MPVSLSWVRHFYILNLAQTHWVFSKKLVIHSFIHSLTKVMEASLPWDELPQFPKGL